MTHLLSAHTSLLVLVAAFGAVGLTSAEESAPLVLKNCLVTPVDDVQVPALRAGLVTQLHVREGAAVAVGQAVAQLDDAEAKLHARSATAEHAAAVARASSDLEVRYAEKTRDVAVTEHEIALAANERQANTVSQIELDRLRLTAEQSDLKVDVGKVEQKARSLETGATQAKAELADEDVRRRKIAAPLAGEVAEIYVQKGEWVEVGRPVMRIVRLDRLRVEGFVRARDRLPGELMGRSVTVVVSLARDERREFSGEITFVSPLVQAGGEYRVWAEVDNRREQGQWLLRPGSEAEITFNRR